MSVCDYCGTEMPQSLVPVVTLADMASHYRQHIEELFTTAQNYDGRLVIPYGWQGPRIQQLRGDNT